MKNQLVITMVAGKELYVKVKTQKLNVVIIVGIVSGHQQHL